MKALGSAGCVWLFLLAAAACAGAAEKPASSAADKDIPYYFLAIHNEPFNHGLNRFFTEESCGILRQMVAKADEHHIKLTLMFAPSWADYLNENAERKAELARWKAKGHEIAGHHHSVYHGNWDGYSALPMTEARERRARMGWHPPDENYYGTLKDFSAKLRLLNPEMKSGCMNDEGCRRSLPDTIVYDTCLGFANYGELGRTEPDMNPEKGRNEYVTVGTYKGIERKWLAHHFMRTAAPAMQIFSSMYSGVYGTVNHSAPPELPAFLEYLEFLHRVDPQGKKSMTVSEVIEKKLLPEKRISDELVNRAADIGPPPPPYPPPHQQLEGGQQSAAPNRGAL